jgi:hypothetical protein
MDLITTPDRRALAYPIVPAFATSNTLLLGRREVWMANREAARPSSGGRLLDQTAEDAVRRLRNCMLLATEYALDVEVRPPFQARLDVRPVVLVDLKQGGRELPRRGAEHEDVAKVRCSDPLK